MQVDVTFDIFSVIIFMGVVMGLYLAYFFLWNRARRKLPNIYIGLILLCLSLIILEIFLNHTGFIVRVITINNFSEPLGFAIAPLLYLYIISSAGKSFNTSQLLHFIPFAFYLFYSLLDYSLSPEYKYNCYIDVYHPELNRVPDVISHDPDPLNIRTFVNELLILQLIIYLIISFIEIRQAFRNKKQSFFARNIKPLSWLRDFTFLILLMLIVLVLIKSIYYKDIGDYLIASFIALSIFITAIYIIRHSSLFQESVSTILYEGRKYEKSSLKEEQKSIILDQLKEVMEKDKYFTNNLASLPGLSKIVRVPLHHISQVINERCNQTFFEFIALYRIEEAKKILVNPEYADITIEEVAENVGYNSKSAFNKTFKKIVGNTPSQFKLS